MKFLANPIELFQLEGSLEVNFTDEETEGQRGVFFLSSAYFYDWEIHIATDILLEVFSLSAEESQAG